MSDETTEEQQFIQQYIIAYVSLKMYGVNRNEVQHQDMPRSHTIVAMREAKDIWNHYISQREV